MMRRVCYILGISLAMISCQNDAGNLAFKSANQNYALVFVDTATVKVSTVLLDSLPTSDSPVMLIGKYADSTLGVVESKAYLQVDLGNAWSPTADLTFDSLVLVMKQSGYYYGDTTQTQAFEVRQMTEDFITYNLSQFWVDELKSAPLSASFYPPGSLYNKRTFRVNELAPPLGIFQLTPRPLRRDSITVRLNDDIGKQWLAEAQKDAPGAFDAQPDFLKYFKGLCVRSASSNASSIVGLITNNFKIRLYYTQSVNGLLTGSHHDFAYNSTYNYNYNNITADRSGTLLAGLSSNKKEVPSSLTNNESYIQAGVGILTKITFPHILDIPNLAGLKQIINASLILEPVGKSFNSRYSLPSQLTLFYTDNSNIPLQTVTSDYSSYPQSASISFDPQYNLTSGYTFSITQYIQALLNAGGSGQTGNALFLSLPISDLKNSVTRAYISNNPQAQFRTRLEIYFLRQNE